MITTLNLTKDIRLPHLDIFLKYYIKSAFEDKERMVDTDEKEEVVSLGTMKGETL